MNIKMIATDMDGTLLGDDHLELPEINIEAFRSATRKGLSMLSAAAEPTKLRIKRL